MRLDAVKGAGLAVFLAVSAALAHAASDVPARSEMDEVAYHLNDDFTDTETRVYQERVLEKTALEDVKEFSISYSSSVQKVDVLEAFTLKADGRKIPVPAGNYQANANTGGQSGPVFSDYATLGLVFPDLEVGDAVHVTYRITQSEPIFPGQFEAADTWSRASEYDDVRVVIDAPASVQAHYQVHEMEQSTEERDGRRILTLTWKNPNAEREKRKDWSVYDSDAYPGFSWSTFPDHEAIAKSYGVRALPKAAVTERIRKLSNQIVKGHRGDRDKAQALYEWVARNITYGGNCVGVGAVVPRDTDFVLDNRMGDCKDHATLLQALLKAQGIAATQALVNAGNRYDLPTVPVVSAMNHVINYLPGLDLFLDSTSSSTPFGYLPEGDAGKPALLVEGYRPGFRTPVTPWSANTQTLHSEIEFLPDGTARGRLQVDMHGDFAIGARGWGRKLNDRMREQLVHRYFDTDGHPGKGTIDLEDADALADHWHYGAQYEKPATLDLPGAGGLRVATIFFDGMSVGRLVHADFEVLPGVRSTCSGGSSTEDHLIRLPAGTTVFAIPDDVKIAQDDYSYAATYSRDGTAIRVHREFVDRTVGPVCTPERQDEYRRFSRRVLHDLRAQIVYQLKDKDSAAGVAP